MLQASVTRLVSDATVRQERLNTEGFAVQPQRNALHTVASTRVRCGVVPF